MSAGNNKQEPKQMQKEKFWAIVQQAKIAAGDDLDARPEELERELASLDIAAIQRFQRRYDYLILRANHWSLWGAAYVMNGGCSDDGFRYFRDWLISEGRDVFEAALSDPDSLANLPRREYFELEFFGYAAMNAFAAKGGGDIKQDISGELFAPSGPEWSAPQLPSLFPRLAAKYLSK